jgi:signal transduction histidine kinase
VFYGARECYVLSGSRLKLCLIGPVHFVDVSDGYKPGGMGMGLAVTRSLVKTRGGQLSARRNPDRGSTFEIVLRMLEDGVAW